MNRTAARAEMPAPPALVPVDPPPLRYVKLGPGGACACPAGCRIDP